MEDMWKGRGDECALAISTTIKLFFVLFFLVSSRTLLHCDVAKGHMHTIVKRQDLNCKRDLKRSGLVIHIGACQRLFKWPVI